MFSTSVAATGTHTRVRGDAAAARRAQNFGHARALLQFADDGVLAATAAHH